jgi:type I restriction-modification system DNA methylase subunit
MSREILQDIIDNFSPDKFPKFFREKQRSFSPRQESFPQYNDEFFSGGVKFGEIKFSEGEKLIACAFKATQPLSERSSRKAQYDKGKKILKDTQSDAGIFIFYDRHGNFRFSLIYPEAVGSRRQWSNFRRFTYFVSHELTNKTFLTRVGDGEFLSLEKIKDAFSVEKVTKEFYEQYRKLFEALLSDLDKNHAFRIVVSKNQINTSDFAKKLLGQIVFLYFLQKKGWLGVPRDKSWGNGDKNFISNLYKQAVKKSENFYNDYLEGLFYDTLNNASREGADPSFSKYFNCRIPFLNGGLFEPEYDWRGTKIYLDNSVFRNIFEVFDRYNFTVEEESPDDKEVAVDPEMLGKVFENLLEENLRKGRGTYYTPREIVHYMCRESLINHLTTETKLDTALIRNLVTYKDIKPEDITEAVDNPQARHRMANRTPVYWEEHQDTVIEKALSSIKVCDPACGSGAFLVGMLNEIVSVRRLLNPGKSEYQMKKEIIQNCIYGVDIDPGAVEIAKLRLWLSLVVDYELADIEPLPNLDYKIMCGNSLLEELIIGEESIKLFDEKLLNVGRGKKDDRLFDLSSDSVPSLGPRKELLQKTLLEKRDHLMKLHKSGQLTMEKRRALDSEIIMLDKELNPRVKKSKIAGVQPMLFQEKASHYFDVLRDMHKQYFNEYDTNKKKDIRQQIEDIELEFIKSSIEEKVKDVDVQIKNLNMQKPEDRKKNAGLMKKKLEYMAIPNEIRRSKVRPYFLWYLNFFEVFQEKGGFDVMIANPPYVFGGNRGITFQEKKFYKRKYFSGTKKINLFALFIENANKLLRQGGYLTYITPNTLLRVTSYSNIREYLVRGTNILEIVDLDVGVFENVTASTIIISLQNSQSDFENIVAIRKGLSSGVFNQLKQGDFNNRGYIFDIFSNSKHRGIISKIKNDSVKLGSLCKHIRFGVVITKNIDKVVENKKANNQWKPFLEGNEIGSYFIKYSGRYLYYKKELLHRSRTPDIFETPKILIQRITGGEKPIKAVFDDQSFYNKESIINLILISGDEAEYKYIVGLLNSRLVNWFYKTSYTNESKLTVNLSKEYLSEIPVKPINFLNQKDLIKTVDKLIEFIKEKDSWNNEIKIAQVKEYERQINQMVYKLYGLTEEEIKIVEGDSRSQSAGELVKNSLDKAGSV